MSNDADALIIRSLPDLHQAILQIDRLDTQLLKAIDDVTALWVQQNGWEGTGELELFGGKLWVAPTTWAVTGQDTEDYHLYFDLERTKSDPEDSVDLISLTSSGSQMLGLVLGYDTIGARPFKKLYRELAPPGLPLNGSSFFLPIVLDREELAKAVEDDALDEALGPLRAALDQLPELAARLQPLKNAIEAEAIG